MGLGERLKRLEQEAGIREADETICNCPDALMLQRANLKAAPSAGTQTTPRADLMKATLSARPVQGLVRQQRGQIQEHAVTKRSPTYIGKERLQFLLCLLT